MESPASESPDRAEHAMAYAIAFLASLLWVVCVMPGVRLLDPSLPDDLATPMHRGPLLLVPALLLLVAAPFAAILSTHPLGLRGLLATSCAFVAAVAAGAIGSHRPHGVLWVAVGHLTILFAVSMRDALRVARAAAVEDPHDVPLSHTDLRLALAILAFLVPASVLQLEQGERAAWYAPCTFVLAATLGDRFAKTLVGLRRTCALCLALLGGYLLLGVHHLLTSGEPVPADWTWAGWAAFGLTIVLSGVAVAWLVLLARSRAMRSPA